MNDMQITSVESAVIILARTPQRGQVKTRLAATLGAEAAAESYRLIAEQLFAECARLDPAIARYLFYAGRDERAIRAWAGAGFRYVPQRSGDFGQRMMAAFETVFAAGARKAVIAGSDVPDLSAEVIAEALHLLDRYPAVIGPDHGGGYYLLGLRMVYPDLFLRNLAWGTHLVYGHTLEIMQGLGLTPAFLPRLVDVDVEGDLWRWLQDRTTSHPLVAYVRQLQRNPPGD
ncbi:MAG: TIGR04282 family arsenosugar biosynthesis glycosyltransferase [Anaerolineae bacterium]|nr:TIGR04282 family arsenosugar biosynthesis glycosyltransferase [Anaerolineae bacterium]